MKKLLAGCLVVVVLLMVVAGVAAYFLYRAARPVYDNARQMVEGASQLADAVATEEKLVNTSAYAGPANGELTAGQVERFLRVQAHVKRTLGERAEAFKEKYKELATTRPDGTEVPPSLSQLLAGLSDMSKVYLDARRAQVDALNAEKFSREEFSWVRLRVYQAAGIEAAGYDPRELEKLVKGVATGAQVTVAQGRPARRTGEEPRAGQAARRADHGVAGDGVVRVVAGPSVWRALVVPRHRRSDRDRAALDHFAEGPAAPRRRQRLLQPRAGLVHLMTGPRLAEDAHPGVADAQHPLAAVRRARRPPPAGWRGGCPGPADRADARSAPASDRAT